MPGDYTAQGIKCRLKIFRELRLIRNSYNYDNLNGIDLSCLRYLFATAEANVSRDLRGFLKIGMRHGMKDDVLVPCFGMTETSSVMIYYDGFRLDNTDDSDRFVPIGCPSKGHKARITDDEGKIVKKGVIGNIELYGDTITSGYYQNDEINKESFTEDGYFKTGDLGFIKDNNIVLTGRAKEIIIINGLNYYVQEIVK